LIKKTTQNETAEVKVTPKKAEKKKQSTSIYLGVTVTGTTLRHGNIYNGDYPDDVNKLIERLPEIKQLMFSPEELVRARQAIKTKGTHERSAYDKLIAKLKEM